MQLRGRVALVTGAGRRVGRALAVGLGAQGMKVAVHYHASDAGARETAQLIREAGGAPWLVSADLTSAEAPSALVRDVVSQLGALDVVINSSAVMERTPLGEVTAGRWDAIMALNLRAPFLLAQAAAPSVLAGRKASLQGGN